MKMLKSVMCAMTAGALAVMLAGCPQKEGPGERAGKAVDSAAEKTGKKIEKAGEAIQDAAKNDKK